MTVKASRNLGFLVSSAPLIWVCLGPEKTNDKRRVVTATVWFPRRAKESLVCPTKAFLASPRPLLLNRLGLAPLSQHTRARNQPYAIAPISTIPTITALFFQNPLNNGLDSYCFCFFFRLCRSVLLVSAQYSNNAKQNLHCRSMQNGDPSCLGIQRSITSPCPASGWDASLYLDAHHSMSSR